MVARYVNRRLAQNAAPEVARSLRGDIDTKRSATISNFAVRHFPHTTARAEGVEGVDLGWG